MLYICLTASILPEAKAKAMLYTAEYLIGQIPIGAAFLKVLIWETHIDTRATVMHICSKLNALDTYIPGIGWDIVKFNAYVKDLMDSLTARGKPLKTS